MESHVSDITRVIQLAVAPVFLLTAIATLINAMNARIGRIIDRRRVLAAQVRGAAGAAGADESWELDLLDRRGRLIYLSIFFAVLSALLVCLVVASAFLGALFAADVSKAVAGLFVLAMVSMVAGLGLFLREVHLAVRAGARLRRR